MNGRGGGLHGDSSSQVLFCESIIQEGSMAHIVIMGAGIGGMAMAYEMRAKAGKADVVTVV